MTVFTIVLFKYAIISMLFFALAKCHDSLSNKFYGEAETWEPNDCTVCVCRNGTPECLATVCRHPDCKEPLYIKGQCCPVCPLIDPSSTDHNEAGNKLRIKVDNNILGILASKVRNQ